ncbi:ABC transporter permease [Falsirhodobacter algicola]|uniref:Transport permease protein n=1 Tax=Falsirhodobacter algicola TaxID=2692330 RepID=A0A8J8MSX0_9RHOB|nr:ABC transporter permease [Falsirhodobacter algicola]QUS36080.1 ABC transporter permease [Falsirhodobacter algicola]
MTSAPIPPSKKPSLPDPSFASARVIFSLMLREMNTTYGRQPGGYAWAIIAPMAGICVMALAMSFVVRVPPLGTNFILFYATGFLPFQAYNHISTKVGNAVIYSRPLLAYPRVTWMDSIVARTLLTVLTEVLIFCLVMGSVLAVVDAHTVLDVGKVIEGFAIMFAFGIGVGLMNCLITAHFVIWPQIFSLANRPLFLAAGIFFLVDELPAKARAVLEWLPVAHGVALMREGFYPSYHPEFISVSYCMIVSLPMIALALLLLRRSHLVALER